MGNGFIMMCDGFGSIAMVDGFVTGMVFIAMGLVMGDSAAKVFPA
jgi:hypothetical protein